MGTDRRHKLTDHHPHLEQGYTAFKLRYVDLPNWLKRLMSWFFGTRRVVVVPPSAVCGDPVVLRYA